MQRNKKQKQKIEKAYKI